jgi:hypothetical protein
MEIKLKCVRVCVCVYIYVYIYVYMCVYIYIYIYRLTSHRAVNTLRLGYKTYNVTLRRVLVTIAVVKKQGIQYYIFWVCDCSLRYPAYIAHAPYCHLWPAPLYNIFSTLSHKRHDFRKNVTEHKTLLNTKRYWTQNVTEHKTLLNTKRYWTQNVTEHKTHVLTFSTTFIWSFFLF